MQAIGAQRIWQFEGEARVLDRKYHRTRRGVGADLPAIRREHLGVPRNNERALTSSITAAVRITRASTQRLRWPAKNSQRRRAPEDIVAERRLAAPQCLNWR